MSGGHWPQWSRPVMGGNTRAGRPDLRGGARAAMEPPGNGRKHLVVTVGCYQRSRAAMEPPGNGRKHRPYTAPESGDLVLAAMEPPGNGRKHVLVQHLDGDEPEAAMEPPGNGRKHSYASAPPAVRIEPQWSRPVMGGNTRRRDHRI